jgi:hypothetical protein
MPHVATIAFAIARPLAPMAGLLEDVACITPGCMILPLEHQVIRPGDSADALVEPIGLIPALSRAEWQAYSDKLVPVPPGTALELKASRVDVVTILILDVGLVGSNDDKSTGLHWLMDMVPKFDYVIPHVADKPTSTAPSVAERGPTPQGLSIAELVRSVILAERLRPLRGPWDRLGDTRGVADMRGRRRQRQRP